MKGWVYVITNKAMPDLVKVGFSSKDPESRAKELYTTGTPHHYVVDYDVLVSDPYQIEQRVHLKLQSLREGKEWFRCTTEKAVMVIRETVGDAALLENFRKLEKAKIEQEIQNEKIKQEKSKLKHEAKTKLQEEVKKETKAFEQAICYKYEVELKKIEEDDFSLIGYGLLIFMGTSLLMPLLFIPLELNYIIPTGTLKKYYGNGTILPLLHMITPFFGAAPLRDYLKKQRLKSPEYRALIRTRETELSEISKTQEKKLKEGFAKIDRVYQ